MGGSGGGPSDKGTKANDAGSDKKCDNIDAGENNVLELENPVLSTIIVGNIRGLKPGIRDHKLEYLELTAKENDAIVIAITESHLKDRIDDNEIHIDGYSVTRSDREVREGRGSIC